MAKIITDQYQILPNETEKHSNFSHVAYTKGNKELLGWCNKEVTQVLMVDACWGMVTCGVQNCHDELIKLVEKKENTHENNR